MSTNTPQGRVTNIQDRIHAHTAKANQPMNCSCGSTHFFVVRAEEFADNGYGSAQLRSLSNNTEALYVCICGRPVPMKDSPQGKLTEGGRARFLRSLASAIEDQKKSTPQGMAAGFVSLAEHEELKSQLEFAQGQISWLMTAVETLTGTHQDEVGEGDDQESAGGTETESQPAEQTQQKTGRRGRQNG